MPEYIEREAVINRLLKVCMTDDVYGMGIQRGVDHAIDVAREAPAADVVAVVRCKDCKNCVLTVDGEYNPQDIVCDWWATDGMKANDFCSYGERRGEDE